MLCSRTRVIMSSEASPLFFRSPLIISFLLCLYDHHFYYNPFNALREINVWTKCGAIDCSIWTLWLSWEERTLAPPMFLFLCVSSLLYCPHWMQKQLLFFRGNKRDYGSYSRLYALHSPLISTHIPEMHFRVHLAFFFPPFFVCEIFLSPSNTNEWLQLNT